MSLFVAISSWFILHAIAAIALLPVCHSQKVEHMVVEPQTVAEVQRGQVWQRGGHRANGIVVDALAALEAQRGERWENLAEGVQTHQRDAVKQVQSGQLRSAACHLC